MPKQEDLKQTLARFVRGGRLSHAVLIEGSRGCGRTELALWLASLLLCQGADAPCGRCLPCKKIASRNHPDVEVHQGEGKGGAFLIDQIRSLRAGLWLAPNESAERIYILTDIDDMNAESQNAFLKSLEEPPPFVRFIMTCRNRSALLDTIVSRSSVFGLEPPSPQECAAELRRQFPQASEEDVSLASLCWDGCVGAASQALGSEERLAPARLALDTYRLLRGGNSYPLMASLSAGASSKESFLEYLERLRMLSAAVALSSARGETVGPVSGLATEAVALSVIEVSKKSASALLSNCSPELVGTWFCGELSKVFGGNT